MEFINKRARMVEKIKRSSPLLFDFFAINSTFKLNTTSLHSSFYRMLAVSLPDSNGNERKEWAEDIVDNNRDLKQLSELLFSDRKVATRFAWMLTDVAEYNPSYLREYLPYLFEISDTVYHFDFKPSFANYWRYCGVSWRHEAHAINLLFQWLESSGTSVTIKSRSLLVLLDLVKKYPELESELRHQLENQADKYTKQFEKHARKALQELKR